MFELNTEKVRISKDALEIMNSLIDTQDNLIKSLQSKVHLQDELITGLHAQVSRLEEIVQLQTELISALKNSQ